MLGSGGAGKSTLSVQLGAVLGLPVIHLDRLHWKPGWARPEREVWRKTVRDLVSRDEWIMDGNYGGSLDIRLPTADTVIFMDFPPLICLWRAIKRRFQHRIDERPDMAPGCRERFDLEFFKWIWNFRRDNRPSLLRLLEEHGHDKKVVILKSPWQAASFLAEIQAQLSTARG